jgi:hypothetical protein
MFAIRTSVRRSKTATGAAVPEHRGLHVIRARIPCLAANDMEYFVCGGKAEFGQ